ncbi:hypothetical protein [Calycomorphotria hydatis]|uniref:Uncharacterized protein n=1 Tax=Calycomorphotria hydatis TaxID=2528027 RepID=A0A517T8G7_9PLAN|nr:hypothetical protein [Calycomorphotria hydatis]QDT64674.1 hypothetical protein V22_19150 [Calycomorphotria hydatis]
MSDIAELAKSKAEALTTAVTSDSRWQLENELMCQVFGFTMYGYVFGVGRIVCFMDVEDIQNLAADQLSGLGIGPKYAEGMMQAAHNEFMQEGNTSLHNQLIGIGHSHVASEDLTELVDSIFQNTEQINQSIGNGA